MLMGNTNCELIFFRICCFRVDDKQNVTLNYIQL